MSPTNKEPRPLGSDLHALHAIRTLAGMALILLFFALPAQAQFALFLADGTPVPPIYDLGQAYAGEPAAAHFRLRNVSSADATLTSLSVAGPGFTLTAPAVPLGIPAQGAIDLTVTFQAIDTGTYSAALHGDGIGILLTARVLPSLTYRVDSPAGFVPLTALDFGTVVSAPDGRGGQAQRRITLRNETTVILTVPSITVQGTGFSLLAAPPSGQNLQPQQGGEFTVVFSPPSTGARQGTLAIGDRIFPLLGIGADPPLPVPSVAIDLPKAASAQQGNLIIRFDAPAQATGIGSATLDFLGTADLAIAFAAGGRRASFSVAPGDTQAVIPFETGTTAGTLTFTVQLGTATVRQSLTIGAVEAQITAAQGIRSSGAIEIRLTGFDNTRTLGGLTFMFFDAAGKSITVKSDATADFAKFFAASDLGGVFLLSVVFPVSGDASQLIYCEVVLSSVAGSALRRVLLP